MIPFLIFEDFILVLSQLHMGPWEFKFYPHNLRQVSKKSVLF